MKKVIIGIIVVMAMAFSLQAAEVTKKVNMEPKDKAVDIVNKVMKMYKEKGREKTFEAINDKKGIFVDGDLYAFSMDLNGVILAHGANEKLINKNITELKDPDGVFFIKEMIKTAKEKSEGWIDYKWTNPESKKTENKSTYVKKYEKEEMLFGCGIYKK